MYTEFFTGSDNFPKGAQYRNVQFTTFVYNPRSALFEGPRQVSESEDSSVVRDVKITQGIPASVIVTSLQSQMWYHYRAEARSGSLWLFETRVKQPESVFGYDLTYLLLRLDKDAPATRVTYNLPKHDLANLHKIELTLNARRVLSHTDLTADERNAFKKLVGETRDIVVDVLQDPKELPNWSIECLEEEKVKSTRLIHAKGTTKAVAIQRIRRIRR